MQKKLPIFTCDLLKIGAGVDLLKKGKGQLFFRYADEQSMPGKKVAEKW